MAGMVTNKRRIFRKVANRGISEKKLSNNSVILVSFEALIEDSIIVPEHIELYTQTIVTTAKLSVISNYALQLVISEYNEIH